MRKLFLFLAMSLCLTAAPLWGQGLPPDFFDRFDAFLKQYVHQGQVDYAQVKQDQATAAWVAEIETTRLSGASPAEQQAFLINAYNLLVIHAAAEAYPLRSVLDVSGFFDQKKYLVAGERMTLNELEKVHLLKAFGDARFHFALVCGAVDCPPLTNEAFYPDRLEAQLQARTRQALNHPGFIRVNPEEETAKLSQIFEWYASDFGGSRASARAFINRYRKEPIPADYALSFYPYDWTLNEQPQGNGQVAPASPAPPEASNAIRYVVSATIPRGQVETKIFNNLYTQATGSNDMLRDRSTFFTTFITSLYGVSDRFNAGVELRYRRVRNEAFPASPFQVFGAEGMAQTREGLTTIGPKIRWAPVPLWSNFSVQSAFWFPLGQQLEGGSGQPFIDWEGATWWTQVFNDFTLGSRFSLFTEIDLLWEDIGAGPSALNRLSTPATVILSYFPHPTTTLYTLGGYSPFWTPSFDYFAQTGLGAKQQVSRKLEFELLYTWFTNAFLQQNGGRASTFNLGVRFNLG